MPKQPQAPYARSKAYTSLEAVWNTTCVLVHHIADILLSALLLMKQLVSVLLAMAFTLLLLSSMISFGYRTAREAIVSYGFCELPIISLIPLCSSRRPPSASPTNSQVDFPGLMAIQHRALDEFLGQSSTRTELALNIKHAELTVHDLMIMVKGSNLTVKDVLSHTLGEFVNDAKESARGLQRLSSKIHGTIDTITAFNVYAMQEIERERRKGTRARLDAVLARTFQASMDTFSSQITRLLIHASETAATLDRLKEHLATTHALCSQEDIATQSAQEDLLFKLWQVLGRNKDQVRDLKQRSSVLKEVQKYRAVAVAYVSATMQTLTAVDADLMELRERLTASNVFADDIPAEVHIASIQSGLYRLQEEKLGRAQGVEGGAAVAGPQHVGGVSPE